MTTQKPPVNDTAKPSETEIQSSSTKAAGDGLREGNPRVIRIDQHQVAGCC